MMVGMTGYGAESLEAAAVAGDWKAAVGILPRSTVLPEVMEARVT